MSSALICSVPVPFVRGSVGSTLWPDGAVSVGVTSVSVSAPTVVFFCTARMRSVRSISTVMTFATIITHSSTTIRPVCERGGFGRRPVP